ncbi:alpha/beta fold hydrolase [Streptomyces alkaliphilus]|uniref:Alpha/beta fold hydrolase n=1 Tax=Streptomyces alkaliphilus TaxID=1472722 RepID=A0A7W3Y133_9ACTN|nr:alpha/beta hydrolase [Streptomyces alkaliphilus]MBB0244254.1 alpha/beta fold hydrolase [Streptomyces alkaliphilus]
MARILCGDTEFGYDEAGGGEPAVVLVHAGLADRRMWAHQFRSLAADHRVIRYDCRGHGETGSGSEPRAHHEDLLALLDALEVPRAALIGCSMGGSYAVEAALAAPERVTALALISPGLSGRPWPEDMLLEAAERVHARIPAERREVYRAGGTTEHLLADALATAEAHIEWMMAGPRRDRSALPHEAWELAVQMYREHLERLWSGEESPSTEVLPEPLPGTRLDRVVAPTLVVNGLDDVPGVRDVAAEVAEGIPGARRIDLPDTGHLAPLEHPAEVTDILRSFLASASTVPTREDPGAPAGPA